MTRQELIESLVQWTHNTGVMWEFNEDEVTSVIFLTTWRKRMNKDTHHCANYSRDAYPLLH